MQDSERQRTQFHDLVSSCEQVLVAYSGGIDSTLVLKVAFDLLGDRVKAVTALSPSLAERDLENARQVAREIGVNHIEIQTTELENPKYQKNDLNRCYFCKTNVYENIVKYGQSLVGVTVFDGTNRDDLGDHRPGLRAARENGVRSPLKEAGIGKDEIRKWSQELGLTNWDRPSNACLSSRIPYGSKVTEEKLKQVEQAEASLHGLGFHQLRVRHYEEGAKVEVAPEELQKAFQLEEKIVQLMQLAGYQSAIIDPKGYRTGSLNSELK